MITTPARLERQLQRAYNALLMGRESVEVEGETYTKREEIEKALELLRSDCDDFR